MLDIGKARAYLRGELSKINRVIEVYEAIADDSYQKRRRKVAAKARASGDTESQLILPAKLNPDAMLWIQ